VRSVDQCFAMRTVPRATPLRSLPPDAVPDQTPASSGALCEP